MAEGPGTQSSTTSSDQSSSEDSVDNQTQVPKAGGSKSPNGENEEQINHGPGLYAVPVLSYMQPAAGFPSNNTLIPFTYNLPTQRSTPETREGGGDQGQQGEQPQQQQQHLGPERRVVVRRFQIAIQLDLMLILKLAAVIFLFNQDGSRQRLALLVFCASVVYLYQTGALAPVVRWLSQGMRRAAAPPQPPRPHGGQGNENIGLAEGQAVAENENDGDRDRDRAIENNHEGGEPAQVEAGNRWWGIVKEVQMIVFGFITSLLPGFHNID